ncbi:hypothetical protein [Nocardioides sp. J54]|uniref:hypothetical protein n=1 Tax=Nocardioides sp. J54 TaxID=935866 RepID=UPI00048BDE40|nr:hypothetical protein [Nocardioides sp. J54]
MKAPLTAQRLGSRACPECERPFADHDETVLVEGEEPVRNRYGGFSDGRTRRTSRRWHVACLSGFEARNAAYRAQVEADRLALIRELGRAAGWSDELIEQAVAKAAAATT